MIAIVNQKEIRYTISNVGKSKGLSFRKAERYGKNSSNWNTEF